MGKRETKEKKQRHQMMQIIVVALAVLVSLAAILIGIASNNESTTHDHDNDSQQQAAEIELRVGLAAGADDIHYKSIEQFKEEVEEKSNGTIQVTIYGEGRLGTDRAMVNALKNGETSVDIVVTDVENFTELDARMDISTLPFIFDSYEDAWAFLDGDTQESIENDLQQQNIRVLAHYSDGFEYMTTTRTTIAQAVDFKNLTFAVEKNSEVSSSLASLGAMTRVVAANELSHILASGQADGYIGSLEKIVDNSISQSQRHLNVTYHCYHAQAFAISESVWDSLTEEQQNIVKAAAESSAMSDRKNVQQNETNIIKGMESAGIRISYPSINSIQKQVSSNIHSYQSKYGDLINDVIRNMNQ